MRNLSGELDAAWSTLVAELKDRGLLESTTILWMGEFGRTPTINNNAGRDHFPAAWTPCWPAAAFAAAWPTGTRAPTA